MQYDYIKPWETLDPWQEEILSVEGNLCLRSGRQVGKSTVISIKGAEFAMKNKNKTVMIIASVERQALLLFEKVLAYIHSKKTSAIKTGMNRPTKHKLQLKNGSNILCLPTGETGYGIRGHTIDLLIADEAAFIPEDVWTAVTPMLAITRGKIILLSTPFGRQGYFYRCFNDTTFKSFHISSEDCPRRNEEFLEHERARMTRRQYAQEYLGEFVDELMQFFSDNLIKQCMQLSRPTQIAPSNSYFLGVDIARMGEDESTFEILCRHGEKRDQLQHIESIVTLKTLTTMSTRLILQLDRQYKFKKIFMDDGGIGVGVFDQLLEDPQTRRKVVGVNNLRRAIDKEETRQKKLLKEDLYNNLLRLMEQGRIKLLDDPEIFQSLKSVQYEYTGGKNTEIKLKIFGKYTHIAEGLIRAAWCVKDKTLNIWVSSIYHEKGKS